MCCSQYPITFTVLHVSQSVQILLVLHDQHGWRHHLSITYLQRPLAQHSRSMVSKASSWTLGGYFTKDWLQGLSTFPVTSKQSPSVLFPNTADLWAQWSVLQQIIWAAMWDQRGNTNSFLTQYKGSIHCRPHSFSCHPTDLYRTCLQVDDFPAKLRTSFPLTGAMFPKTDSD